jgi:hypothetical protein
VKGKLMSDEVANVEETELTVYMTSKELEELGKAMYQVKSWKSRLAMDLDVYVSTINRWLNGQTRITKRNALCIRTLHAELLAEKAEKPKRLKEVLTVNLNAID